MRARRDRRTACRAERARRRTAARPASPPRFTCPSTGSTTARSTSRVERCDDELEVAQIDDLVAPELQAHGIGHAERVDVEDAAAQAELRDVLDHRHALEADALEMLGELARPAHVALAQLDAQIGERAGKPRALEQRARRRERARGSRRDSAARASRRARRRPRRAARLRRSLRAADRARRASRRERVQIGEQPLGLRHAVGDDDEEARRKPARERGDERRVGGAGQPGDAQLARAERAAY